MEKIAEALVEIASQLAEINSSIEQLTEVLSEKE